MRLALFQPDIPQNAGAMMRLAACLNIPMDIIEPAGFVLSDRRLRRAGMDYLGHLDLTRHDSWQAFLAVPRGRLILLTTQAKISYLDAAYRPDDTLLMGRESAGVPPDVHNAADLGIAVPMAPGLRSLNVALASAIVLGEAMRQTQLFPTQGFP
ncbi:MAG: tRNA (cytidine(34)-2'-O)-methyltransferase [Alphaproteobacteria bacterium]